MHFHREIKSWYSTILFISNSLKSDPLNCSIHHVLKHEDADSSYAIKQSLSKSKDLILITLCFTNLQVTDYMGCHAKS